MTVQTIPVRAADGHCFDLTLHRADTDGAPLLLFLCAMGTRSRFYHRLGAAMAVAGISFASMDWRGMESSSARASRKVNWAYEDLIALDIAATHRCLRALVPAAPCWIGGHSLGGQLAAQYASRQAAELRGLVLIAAGTVHFRAWPGTAGLRLLALTQSAALISQLLGHYPGQRLGFAGREARGVIRDWARTARFGRYRFGPDPAAQQDAVRRLQKPVLALSFAGDTLSPATAMDRLVAKLRSCEITRWHWDKDKTGGETKDHFSWAKQPEHIAPDVAAWLHRQI